MTRPAMPAKWWRRMLPDDAPRPKVELYAAPLELRYSATRELLDAQATVESCAEAYAVTGSEEVLALLVAAMRQHRRATLDYLTAFAPATSWARAVNDDTMS